MHGKVASSFRDPSGQVYQRGDRIYRTVSPAGRADFEFVRDTGYLDTQTRAGKVVPAQVVGKQVLGDDGMDACYVLEHPRLDFISHPYEWSFWGLRAAALLTLDLHLDALKHGITMSDASAYNVQFDGPNPVLIDYLSFTQYHEGQLWAGHKQFCEQFLNPLLLTAHTGVPFQPLLRSQLNGIPAAVLAPLLPAMRRWSPRVFLHVGLPARLARAKSATGAEQLANTRLPRTALQRMLDGMRGWIAQLAPPRNRQSAWQSYAAANSYAPAERREKEDFVAAFVGSRRPGVVWDLGCNTGDYARVALGAGSRLVIGFEADPGALDAAFQRAQREKLRFLPLHQDLLNPSPDQGWRERERHGLGSRAKPDAVLMLALIHHLAIANNVPLMEVVDWVTSLAPAGVIEFVPKDDPQAARLLALRKDIFPGYTREAFLEALRRRCVITATRDITGTGRLLVAFDRA